jgi:formate dehydrogenase subunit gamma
MNGTNDSVHAEPGVALARDRQDVAVGDVIVRHKRSARMVHWGMALCFLACVLSGMPIWSPVFGWMAGFLGGLESCRWLHPWSGVAFVLSTWLMFGQWARDMRIEPADRAWFGPRFLALMLHGDSSPEVGKYNGGQKLLFWSALLAALLMGVSGIVLWWPEKFSADLRLASILAHVVGFLFFACSIIVHVYLGTAAEPGTFRSMTRGTVTRSWARLHHPRWFREVTGEDDRKRQP